MLSSSRLYSEGPPVRKQLLTSPKSASESDNIWWSGSSSPTTVTVFEAEQAPSGLLGIDGEPLIRKRQGIGFVSFDD